MVHALMMFGGKLFQWLRTRIERLLLLTSHLQSSPQLIANMNVLILLCECVHLCVQINEGKELANENE